MMIGDMMRTRGRMDTMLIKKMMMGEMMRTRRKMNTMLTKKMMIGEMMRTRRRMAIPRACCWLAAFNSDFTVPLQVQG